MTQVDTKAMALSILANIPAHTVNRVEKMGRTLDVMCENHIKKAAKGLAGHREFDDSRGYGQGKNTGD